MLFLSRCKCLNVQKFLLTPKQLRFQLATRAIILNAALQKLSQASQMTLSPQYYLAKNASSAK